MTNKCAWAVAALLLIGCQPARDMLCPKHLELIERIDALEQSSNALGRALAKSWEYERETSRRYVAENCQR